MESIYKFIGKLAITTAFEAFLLYGMICMIFILATQFFPLLGFAAITSTATASAASTTGEAAFYSAFWLVCAIRALLTHCINAEGDEE